MIRYFLIFSFFLSFACERTSPLMHQTARLSLGSDPTILDPRRARDLDSQNVIRMLFEGLTRIGKTGKVELALAKQVEISEDGLQYIFHLRKSKWCNGDPVTAFDFVT